MQERAPSEINIKTVRTVSEVAKWRANTEKLTLKPTVLGHATHALSEMILRCDRSLDRQRRRVFVRHWAVLVVVIVVRRSIWLWRDGLGLRRKQRRPIRDIAGRTVPISLRWVRLSTDGLHRQSENIRPQIVISTMVPKLYAVQFGPLMTKFENSFHRIFAKCKRWVICLHSANILWKLF